MLRRFTGCFEYSNVKLLGSTIGILLRITNNGIREHTDPFFHIGDRDERG